ncbi:MAG: patatin family protein [Deltaproteobacteria bacterium]|nr:patatin family protein [Deltaproteobacteria bacterium]
MDYENIGLVLEGGGLRGVYTSGVIRFFMDKGIQFPYVVGVSMGVCNGANYISGQPERSRIVNIDFVNDPRYISYKRLLLKGELFGMDFIFNTIPSSLVPFDKSTFLSKEAKFVIGVTDCETGNPVYYEKNEVGDDSMDIFRATCSIPFLAKPVHYKGRIFMDGGLIDPVPIKKSMDDGNDRNVLILTRPKGYRKKPLHLHLLARLWYPRFKGLQRALAVRHELYNETMDMVDELESSGQAISIRPLKTIEAARFERDKNKLHAAYNQGYEDASSGYERLRSFLNPHDV